ncbi:MAG: acylphosphatase [Elusimicrobia bacterium]|nr:acylphosphatase [Candidatus Liberimonas magnetica]
MSKISNITRVHAIVKGSVQGIGYRWFVQKTANNLNLTGWVRNLSNGDVELEAEGERKTLDEFLKSLNYGHKWAQVTEIETQWLQNENSYRDFEIRF